MENYKIHILFDCPNHHNDKIWLYHGFLEIYGGSGINLIDIGKNLSVIKRKGTLGRIEADYITVNQILRALRESAEGDVVICWGTLTGMIMNFMSRIFGFKRYIVAMNWLSPANHTYVGNLLRKYMITNPQCHIIVNAPDSIRRWENALQLKGYTNYHFIPDTYDTNIEFRAPYRRESRYCFTGGENNRDWKLVMEVAECLPKVQFVCVAYKDDFMRQVDNIPSNVRVYFSLSASKYYEIMQNSNLVLLPLRSDKVAGLINITHAAQYGQLCAVTKTPATELYYSNENQMYLMKKDAKKWVQIISTVMGLSEQEYCAEARSFQDFIKHKFNPQKIVGKIDNVIREARGQ